MPALEQLVDAAIARLREASPTPRIDVEALAQHAFGVSRAALIAGTGATPSDAHTERFLALIERRRAGEPVAYLTGRREFWSLELRVSPAVLIPRPETELLVEQALLRIPIEAAGAVFDLGTGSGALALAIAHERPHARVYATDSARDALDVAVANAARLGLHRVDFRHGDWFAPLAGIEAEVVVSNPPYVRVDDPHLAAGDLRFEPRAALAAGADGLDAIRRIAADAPHYLRRGGWLLLEHGRDQGDAVRALLAGRGYTEIAQHRDMSGHDRVVSARRI